MPKPLESKKNEPLAVQKHLGRAGGMAAGAVALQRIRPIFAPSWPAP